MTPSSAETATTVFPDIDRQPGEGIDTVLTSINYTLGTTLEDLELIGTTANAANGNNLNNGMKGSARDDTLQGGGGYDTIFGRDGDDVINGGKQQDWLTGGNGNDTFKFNTIADSTVTARDLITDLQAGDRLDFSVIDADQSVEGNQAFTTVATATGAGQLVLAYNAGTDQTTVSLYVTADTVADMEVLLSGQVTSSTGWLL